MYRWSLWPGAWRLEPLPHDGVQNYTSRPVWGLGPSSLLRAGFGHAPRSRREGVAERQLVPVSFADRLHEVLSGRGLPVKNRASSTCLTISQIGASRRNLDAFWCNSPGREDGLRSATCPTRQALRGHAGLRTISLVFPPPLHQHAAPLRSRLWSTPYLRNLDSEPCRKSGQRLLETSIRQGQALSLKDDDDDDQASPQKGETCRGMTRSPGGLRTGLLPACEGQSMMMLLRTEYMSVLPSS